MKLFSEKLILVGMLVCGIYLDAMQVKRPKPPVPARPPRLRLSQSTPQVGQLSSQVNDQAEKNRKKSADLVAYKDFLKTNQKKKFEAIKAMLLQCNYDLETYEQVCLDLYNDPHTSGPLLARACRLLAWQISATKKTANGQVNIRDIIAYIYMNFERDDDRIFQYSKKRCHMLATFIFDVLRRNHWSVDGVPLSEDGRKELAAFLCRRDDEPALKEAREWIPEISEMQSEEAFRTLQSLTTQASSQASVVSIEHCPATLKDKLIIAFYQICKKHAGWERRCSTGEEKDWDAFEGKFAPGGNWPQRDDGIRAQLKSMREVIAIRKAHDRAWQEEAQRKEAIQFSQLTPKAQQEFKPSIFTPLANFLRNRYLHYGALLVAGVVVGVYGYWAYRKIFQKNPAQLVRWRL